MSQWNFNLSYSAYSLYKESPLTFFYRYIMKMEDENEVSTEYGDAGNVVHDGAEAYLMGKDFDFDEEWEKKGLQNRTGLNGKLMDRERYRKMYKNACVFIDNFIEKDKAKPELRVEHLLPEGLLAKGFIDVVEEREDGVILIDWKSNARNDYQTHRLQRLFYAWLYHKKYGVIPRECKWVYLKDMAVHKDSFTEEEVRGMQEDVEQFIRDIRTKGREEQAYPVGDYDNPFNGFQARCQEQERIRNGNYIIANRKGNYLEFPKGLPDDIERVADHLFSYKVENYQWVDAYRQGKWDGRKRLYKNGRMPYAFIEELRKFITRYNERAGTAYELYVLDKRDKRVVDKVFDTEFREPVKKLRPYQEDALKAIERYKVLSVQSGTGTGKTLLAAEFIRRHNRRSLFLVHRVELARQTKEEFEEHLGVECGMMTEGNLDTSKQVTVSSIQTIYAILNRKDESSRELIRYLYNVTVCFADEAQTVKKSGMYGVVAKHLPNVEYMVGLSATPYRNGPDSLELYALCGHPHYKVDSNDLEEKGYLCPVDVRFIDMPARDNSYFDEFHEKYQHHIVEHETRNEYIVRIAERMKEKGMKVLILVARIDHGEKLRDMIPGSYFLHGSVPSEERREMFEKFKNTRDLQVMVAMASIASAGWNIVDLDVMVNASASASIVQVIQAIGRLRRNAPGKERGYYIDFNDGYDGFDEAADRRKEQLAEEGYMIGETYEK